MNRQASVDRFNLRALEASAQSGEELNVNIAQSEKTGTRTRATAKIIVTSSEAKPYDQTASPALIELRLNETFTGDIDGESPVRALQVQRDDGLPAWPACNDSPEN